MFTFIVLLNRLQIWGGSMTAKKMLIPESLPAFVTKYPDIVGRIKATGAFHSSPHGAPNHVLMNEYLPGQGIMPHEDGPAYHSVVATLSLGSHTMFHYYRYKSRGGTVDSDKNSDDAQGDGRPIDPIPVLSVLLERRSLVITTTTFYRSYLHGIDAVTEDRFSPSIADGDKQSTPTVANVDLLSDSTERAAVLNGGVLERDIRYSLTCRDVEKVASGLPFVKR